MIQHFLFFLHLILTSGLFAMLEIQIEGPHGWAEKLPTWRVENRWTRMFFSEKPLTGYHFFLMLFMLSIVHIPYALGLAPFSLPVEMRIISFFIFFSIVEDVLWFVLNPAFGLRRFKQEHIWWHAPKWWGIMPRDYWIFLPVAIALYAGSWLI